MELNALHALDAALQRPRDAKPGLTLTKAIVAIASQRRNPLPFELFAQLYVLALNCLDPSSQLAVGIRAYFKQPPYDCEVTTLINSYNGRTPYSKTRESRRDGFTRPFRTYSPAEITYKWSVSTMQYTFLPILEEIILVHKCAATCKILIRGGGCEAINTIDNADNFNTFCACYEDRVGRPYMGSGCISPAPDTLAGLIEEARVEEMQAADRIHQFVLRSLGSHVKADGITAQNLPRDHPDYTATVRTNLDRLEFVKRKINYSYSVPQIRNSEVWLINHKREEAVDMVANGAPHVPSNAPRTLTRKNTPFIPRPASADPFSRTNDLETGSACDGSCGSDTDSSSDSSTSTSSSAYSSRTSSREDLSNSAIRITITGGNVTINLCDCQAASLWQKTN